jgi:hypothetical protein
MFACGQHKSITPSNNMVEPSVSFSDAKSHESFLNQFKYGLANLLRLGQHLSQQGGHHHITNSYKHDEAL